MKDWHNRRGTHQSETTKAHSICHQPAALNRLCFLRGDALSLSRTHALNQLGLARQNISGCFPFRRGVTQVNGAFQI